jgi:hypothetical protein
VLRAGEVVFGKQALQFEQDRIEDIGHGTHLELSSGGPWRGSSREAASGVVAQPVTRVGAGSVRTTGTNRHDRESIPSSREGMPSLRVLERGRAVWAVPAASAQLKTQTTSMTIKAHWAVSGKSIRNQKTKARWTTLGGSPQLCE